MEIFEKYLNVKNEIGAIQKTALNPFHKSKYAPLSEIQKHVNPILFKNRLVMTWDVEKKEMEVEVWTFRVKLIDIDNPEKTLNFSFDTLSDTNNKNAIQGWGSTITYAKRYIYGIIFEIAFDDEDPDAKLQDQIRNLPTFLDKKQLSEIIELAAVYKIPNTEMSKYIKANGWTDSKHIPLNEFDRVKEDIKRRNGFAKLGEEE